MPRSIVWWILCANQVLGRQNQTAGCLTNHSQVSVRCRARERESETHTADTHAQTNTRAVFWVDWRTNLGAIRAICIHLHGKKHPGWWCLKGHQNAQVFMFEYVRYPTWLPRQHIFFFYQRPDILNEHNEPVDAHKARLHSCFRGIDGQNLDLIISRVDESTIHNHSINIIYHIYIWMHIIIYIYISNISSVPCIGRSSAWSFSMVPVMSWSSDLLPPPGHALQTVILFQSLLGE